MYNVTDEQVDFILNDIKAHGVILEDLQDNLIDHMCCIIEEELPEGGDFYKFYESILPRFFKQNLKELQEETDNLLTFKHYYAMKKTLNISGISSALLILIGAIFKTLHWPGAGITLLLGGLLFCFVFLPLMIVLKFKDETSKTDKWVLSLGFLLGIGMSVGIIFKLMYWPYANLLIRWSETVFIFGYVPLYFFTRIRRPDLKFNTIVNSVLMMVCGGMLYALFNLGYSINVKESVYASYSFMNDNTQEISAANNQIYQQYLDNKLTSNFHKTSEDLANKISAIKINVIAKVEGVSETKAKTMTLGEMKKLNDSRLVRQYFVNGSDDLSLTSLLEEVETYNKNITKLYPNNKEKLIAVERLQLDKTIAELVLYQLSQIQLQIANTENSYLNSISVK